MPRRSQTVDCKRVTLQSIHPRSASRSATKVPQPSHRARAQKIRLTGQVDPVVVRPHPTQTGEFELLTGMPRWRAAFEAQLKSIPVLICEARSVDEALAGMETLTAKPHPNPMLMADTLRVLLDQIPTATHQDLADLSGLARNAVTHYLLLQGLPPPVRQLLARARLSFGHAKVLCGHGLPAEPARQVELAHAAVHEGWSVRQLESRTFGSNVTLANSAEAPVPTPAAVVLDPNISALSDLLSRKTGMTVSIEHQVTGAGRIIFGYYSLEEADNLLRLFPADEFS